MCPPKLDLVSKIVPLQRQNWEIPPDHLCIIITSHVLLQVSGFILPLLNRKKRLNKYLGIQLHLA